MYIEQALSEVAEIEIAQGDFNQAQRVSEEILSIGTASGHKSTQMLGLFILGFVALKRGREVEARSFSEDGLAIAREIDDRYAIAWSLSCLSLICRADDLNLARSHAEESVSMYRGFGVRSHYAGALTTLALVLLRQGKLDRARSLETESLRLKRTIGHRLGIAESLGSLATMACNEEQHDRAACLWGAVSGLRGEIAAPLPPCDQDEYEQNSSAAREALGEEAYDAAWAKGRAATMTEAISFALDESSSTSSRLERTANADN